MKIGIFSDCHCGYKFGEERGEDSFIALEEAMEKTMDCDIILIAGDLFDTRIPKPEIYAKTSRILSTAQHFPSRTKLIEIINKEKHQLSPLAFRGIPVVMIHGTHEKRSKYTTNPIQSLEDSGLIVHLDCATAVFDIDGEKVAVHGMSGVSDRYAMDKLKDWDPKPIENAKNIFMIHQSIDPYIYSPLEPPTIKIDDLPQGFDIYVLGHMHWNEIRPLHQGRLILCGSTTPTSLHKIEADQPKCVYKYDGNEIEKVELEKQRKIVWKEFDFEPNIKERIEDYVKTISVSDKKPIVNIKVKGLVKKDSMLPKFSEIEEKFGDKSILNINKNLEVEGLQEQIEMLKTFKTNRLSPEEHGLRILQNNLDQMNCRIKVEDIFDYLVEGNTELIFNLLTGNQKTLK
ncbi:MAG: DNA repair exonuclease [Candidatus Aenigmarchaeota archaeon]|nr:DNA repair exonuclease [Candidatus Aenigmarchaeota archaeon]